MAIATEEEVRAELEAMGLRERLSEEDFILSVRGEVRRRESQASTAPALGRLSAKLPTKTTPSVVPERSYRCEACHDEGYVLTVARAVGEARIVRGNPIPCPRCVPLTDRARAAGVEELFVGARLATLTRRAGNAAAVDFARGWDGTTSALITSRTGADGESTAGGDSAWGTGKALALDTPIPTPMGWTSMGEIAVGDEVFAEDGRPCHVTYATPVQLGRQCFNVEFSDGTVITADKDHLWLTESYDERQAGLGVRSVRSTEQIAATLLERHGYRNHAVPIAAPLELPESTLPLDPYALGVWLGDGDTARAMITSADSEIVDELELVGVGATGRTDDTRSRASKYTLTQPGAARLASGRLLPGGSLTAVLRALGVIGRKHIPMNYLRASTSQRLSLLQGLMDTDGYADARTGVAEFTSTSEALALGTYELICSLGMKATMREARATFGGRDCGTKYRISFTSYVPLFRLARKLSRQRTPGAQADRQRRRYVVAVRERTSVPVRCIQVDSPSSLYLCSRSMIPTHNTHLACAMLIGQIERARPGKFLYAKHFLSGIQSLFGAESGAVEAYIQAISATPLLVLDDLGAERPTDWAREQIRTLVDDRYRRKLVTVITTNFGTLERIAEVLGGAVASRLREYQHVKVGGPDMRGTA